jgi:hypothetical protein
LIVFPCEKHLIADGRPVKMKSLAGIRNMNELGVREVPEQEDVLGIEKP